MDACPSPPITNRKPAQRSASNRPRPPAIGSVHGYDRRGRRSAARLARPASPRLRAHRRRLQHRVRHSRLSRRPGRVEAAAAGHDSGVPFAGCGLQALLGARLRRVAAFHQRRAQLRASRVRRLGSCRHAPPARDPERRRPAPARRQPRCDRSSRPSRRRRLPGLRRAHRALDGAVGDRCRQSGLAGRGGVGSGRRRRYRRRRYRVVHGAALRALRRPAQAGRRLLWRERAGRPLRAGVRGARAAPTRFSSPDHR